jgi:cell division protein FtsW (lipid II flippase)
MLKTQAYVDDEETQRQQRAERLLMALATAFMAVNALALALLGFSGAPWGHFLVWCAAAWGSWWYLRRVLPRRDPLLLPLVMLLSGWGLLMIDRLATNFADRQTLWLALSAAAMCATATVAHLLRWLRQYRYLLLILGLALLISTILLGRNPSGLPGAPELWLGIGNVFFQPSEALKLILVAFLASYLADQALLLRSSDDPGRKRSLWWSPRILGPMLLMWGLCVVVLIWQRDLGTAALFFLVFLALLYVATGQWWIVASGLALTAAAGLVAYRLFSVVQLRVDIWLNPWPDADGRAYQVVQSLMAVANGGIFGTGIGQGAPNYIPVVHSDFVFAALAEEWGLLGVLALVACLGVLALRGFRIAGLHAVRPFYALLTIGITMVFAVQSLMIMGGVIKLFPLTGVTLPFVSYGGSSLLMSFIMAGILLRLSCEVD